MRLRLLSVVAVWALLLAACGTGEDPTLEPPVASPPALAEVTLDGCVIDQGTVEPAPATGRNFTTIASGKLTVGSDTNYPPFEEIKDGEAVGFDMDLIREVGKRIGPLDVEIQSSSFEPIFQALAADKFDVVISAVTIKDERKQTVDFTDPYFKADQSLAVRTADADEIGGVEDLSGLVVGVQAGTTGEDCAKNAVAQQHSVKEVRSYDTLPDAFNDLAANRVDAVLADLPTAKQISEDRTGFSVIQVIRTKEEYGIAVSKQNPNLREAINRALKEIREDGTYERLFEKWFKTKPPAE